MSKSICHTPAPWKFHLGRGANPRLHIQTIGGYQIASTPEVNKHETREADARLIAASPSLLSFVRSLASSGNIDAMSMLDLLQLSE